MAPADVAPVGAGHVLLEEQVVHAVVVHGGMGLVHPELVGAAVELGPGVVTGQQVLQPDFLELDFGNLGLFVGLGDFLAGEGAGIELHLIQIAADCIQEACGEPLALAVAADEQGPILCVGDFRTGGHGPGGHQLAVQVQLHVAALRIEGGCHMVPFVLLQIVAVGPDAEPFIAGAHLEGQTAMALIAQNKAPVFSLVHLADDGGELVVAVVGGIGIVPLKGSGGDPGADGQCGAGDLDVVFVVGNVGGAVEEQAAALDTLFPPLGVLILRVGGMGQMIVQLHIRQIAGSIGNHQALAFIQLQVQHQVRLMGIGASEYQTCGSRGDSKESRARQHKNFLFHMISFRKKYPGRGVCPGIACLEITSGSQPAARGTGHLHR